MKNHRTRQTAKRIVDALLLILLLVIVLIAWSGGYSGDILGFHVSARTPLGPIKLLLALLLVRAAVSLRRADFWLLMVAIAFSLGIAELALRVWDAPITRFQLAQIHRPSPELEWEPIPGVSSVGNTGATYRINARGCRDEEFPPQKPEGVFRVLAVGDSFTFGMGVEARDTYPKQLQRLLLQEGISAEVINCGVIGHDMWQHTVTLRKKALVYHPDLVILGIYYNDLSVSFPPERIHKPGYKGKNPFAKHGAKKWLHRSYLYNTLRNIEDLLKYKYRARLGAKHVQGIAERKTLLGPSNPDNLHYRIIAAKSDPQLYADFKTSLAQFVSTARAAGVRVLVLLIPDSVQLNDAPWQALNGIVAEAAAEAGAPFLDSTPFLERQDDLESLYLFPDDAHNSPKGLEVIAKALLEALRRQELLPSGSVIR